LVGIHLGFPNQDERVDFGGPSVPQAVPPKAKPSLPEEAISSSSHYQPPPPPPPGAGQAISTGANDIRLPELPRAYQKHHYQNHIVVHIIQHHLLQHIQL
jgi:hypothetical protein